MNKNLPKRKDLRLKKYDYYGAGLYFLTICTQGCKRILSSIVGGDALDAPDVELTEYGRIAGKHIKQSKYEIIM